jgi:glycosyltransferase involved in cell wall biosynthesis
MPAVSVIVRARDEARSIGRTLDLLAAQTAPPAEVVVVDSGSTDGTPDIARERGARVVQIPAADFTFGRALNAGCASAGGEVLVALSAHAYPTERRWLEQVLDALADERVACASGDRLDVDGRPLRARRLQDLALARARPCWGYSNAAGAFRAELWREAPFREDLPGAEDKAWAWSWLERGRLVAIDPALAVEHDHSHDGLVDSYRRARREWAGLATALGVAPIGLGDLTARWWADREAYRSAARARLSRRRVARLVGEWQGRREAAA